MQYDHIPESLRTSGKFCVWGYRNKDGRQTKIPYSPRGGKAKSNNPDTFGTFAEAVAAQRKYPDRYFGIGLGLFGNLVGIDVDHCVEDSGQLSPMAQDIISRLGSYTEFSPSGKGVHIYCRADRLSYDTNTFYLKNSEIGLEIYAAGLTNRYLTMTGDAIVDEDINERGPEIVELLEKYMRRSQPRTATTPAQSPSSEDTPGTDNTELDDAELLNRAFAAKNGAKFRRLWEGDASDYIGDDGEPDDSAADQALCNELCYWTGRDAARMDRLFRQSGLWRTKWDEKRGAMTYGEMTIQKAISDCREVWNPRYRSPQSEGQKAALAFLQSVDLVHNRRYQRDDIGAGYLLADYLKPFARPTPESKGWRFYDGRRWVKDTAAKRVEAAAKDLARAIGLYAAAQLQDEEAQTYFKWAARWAASSNRKTYIAEASSVHPVSESDFDCNPWLLNVGNGTLDLRTGELRKHSPDDLISRLAPVIYDPAATCPRWEQFVSEIMEPDLEEIAAVGGNPATIQREKASFLQRFFGYCLTGSTDAEVFLVCYGPTSRNGKGTAVESVRAVLGDYAQTVSAETVLLSRGRDSRAPSEDIARLVGIRFASIGEPPKGSKLDAARIKSLTGGDTVNARFLGENSFDFKPQAKLLLHTNHLPECSDMSVFDSDRAMVLKFCKHYGEGERDTGLKKRFLEPKNQSAILNWMVTGLKEYQKAGFRRPAAVVQATREYRRDGDKISRFIDEALDQSGAEEERAPLVYRAYQHWCRENGQFPESSRNFYRALERAGIQISRKRPRSGGEKTNLVLGYKLVNDYLDAVI